MDIIYIIIAYILGAASGLVYGYIRQKAVNKKVAQGITAVSNVVQK